MTEHKARKLTAVRGGFYPKSKAGYAIAKADPSVRPGDPRIEWVRFEAGDDITPPYPELVKSLKVNRLVKEVN